VHAVVNITIQQLTTEAAQVEASRDTIALRHKCVAQLCLGLLK